MTVPQNPTVCHPERNEVKSKDLRTNRLHRTSWGKRSFDSGSACAQDDMFFACTNSPKPISLRRLYCGTAIAVPYMVYSLFLPICTKILPNPMLHPCDFTGIAV